ncbi:MAG: hypothetical protein ACRDYE_07365, partial [Acidimicrobiales bacterium]
MDNNRWVDETPAFRVLHSMHESMRSVIRRRSSANRTLDEAAVIPEPAEAGAVPRRQRRRSLAKAGVALSTVGVVVAGTAGIAFANAANPLANSQGTATLNTNGTVTVTVGGTWDWGSSAGLSGGGAQDCSGRWGVGWAVDWWGMSSSSAASSIPGLTNASGATLDPGGSIKTSAGQYFHVNTATQGTVAAVSAGAGSHAVASAEDYDAALPAVHTGPAGPAGPGTPAGPAGPGTPA